MLRSKHQHCDKLITGNMFTAGAALVMSVWVAAAWSSPPPSNCGQCICQWPSEGLLEVICTDRKMMKLNAPDISGYSYDEVWANFEGNDISLVTPMYMRTLKKLSLARNHVSGFYIEAFKDLRALERLNLAHNEIENINIKTFMSLTSLQILDLSFNKLKEIPSKRAEFLKSLEVLDLSFNLLEIIDDDSFISFPNLQSVNLTGNNIIEIHAVAFSSVPKLVTINLSANRLVTFPKDITYSAKSLMFLNVSHNSFKEIALEQSNSLKVLDASFNNLTSLNLNLKNFQTLQELYINNNSITSIDNSLSYTNVSVLNLSKNAMTDFPAMLLPNLQILDLGFNLLKEMPASLSGNYLPKLRTLVLDGNLLSKLRFTPETPFRSLQALSVSSMPSVLELAAGDLDSLVDPSAEGCGLNLTMANNKHLSTLREDALQHVKLCELDLSGNALISLPRELTEWQRLQSIDLQGNPWNCQCSLQWLVDVVVARLYQVDKSHLLYELRCATPERFEGVRLVHFANHSSPVLCSERLVEQKPFAEESLEGGSKTMVIVLMSLGAVFLVLMVVGLLWQGSQRIRLRKRNRRF